MKSIPIIKSISYLIELIFYLLAFTTPLLITTFTNELFEWPKMMWVYLLTLLLIFLFLLKNIVSGSLALAKTPFDIVLLLFFLWSVITTIFSINPNTSFFGYYSRFNGGLLSLICYLAIAYIFITEMGSLSRARQFLTILLASATIVSIYGVLQRLGIDRNYWVQHSWERVFSTLGQPNWLAAYLGLLLLPLMSFFIIRLSSLHQIITTKQARLFKIKSVLYAIFLLILILLFGAALYFTFSRSGYIALAVGLFLAMLVIFLRTNRKSRIFFLGLAVISAGIFLTFNGARIFSQSTESETSQIRLIVWKGAVNLIRSNPILGTGPETFAYSFLAYRPAELNNTTEWDFIFNKPHNEYLGFAAGGGLPALVFYLAFIFSVSFISLKFLLKQEKDQSWWIVLGLWSGLVTLWVSNFFGFSVVITQLFFFIFPMLILVEISNEKVVLKTVPFKKALRFLVLPLLLILIAGGVYFWSRFWFAEIYFVQGRGQISDNPELAVENLTKSVFNNPLQPRYRLKLAEAYATAAVEITDSKASGEYLLKASREAQKTYEQNPQDYILRSGLIKVYLKMARVEDTYIQIAINLAETNVRKAPSSAYDHYYLATLYLSQNELEKAKKEAETALSLRPEYGDAIELIKKTE